MVFDVLHGRTQRLVYRPQEEFEMAACRRLGNFSLCNLAPCQLHINSSVQGMQFFRFIFLARSWVTDRSQLDHQLSKLGQRTQQGDRPLSLVIYPEGTLVSDQTKPISKKYADKLGIVSHCSALWLRSKINPGNHRRI